MSIQMGFGAELIDPAGKSLTPNPADYWKAKGTNSDSDVQVQDTGELIEHLEEIGFEGVYAEVRPSFSDTRHNQWVYARCTKPI